MPYSRISANLTVPSEHASQICEMLESCIDQLALRDIPVFDSHVSEECADPPEDAEEGLNGNLGTA